MNRPNPKQTHSLDFDPKRAEKSGWSYVYALVKKIPRGRVITYGQLAKWLRLPGGARTAGRAMFACPSGSGVPWHRVLGSGGRILLRDPHSQLQRQLLESEGVTFSGSHVDLPAHSWSPKAPGKHRARSASAHRGEARPRSGQASPNSIKIFPLQQTLLHPEPVQR